MPTSWRESCDRYRHLYFINLIWYIIMVALWNTADHYIFILWFLSFFLSFLSFFLSFFLAFFFFSSPNLSRRRLDVYHTCTHLSVNLECRSETCCLRLAGNAGPKKLPKNRHLGTIAQICRAISSQLRHVSTIGKKTAKQQYILHMTAQYGELRPTSGWDPLASCGHPCKFKRFSRLGSVTARHSSSGHEQNFAALNRATITLGIGPQSSSFFLSLPNRSRRILDIYHTSTHGVALVQI